jgi:uncharacterized membrane protein YbhN (UPF0104 family)
MVADLGGPALPKLDVVRIFMIANLGRYIPGKVWQIAGLAALAKRHGVPPVIATGAAVLGQGIALVAASAIGVVTLIHGPPGVRRWGLAVGVVLGVVIVVGMLPPVFRKVVGLWFRLARQDPLSTLASADALRWLGLFVMNWALYVLAFWMLAASFGYQAPLLPVASAFAAAYVLGYVMIFAPAGVGVREGFLIAFLTPHLGAAPASVLAIASRLWTTVVEVVPAGAFWVVHLSSRHPMPGEKENAGG